jgi:hypothetical protein
MHLRHISPRSSDWMDAMDEEAGGRGWQRLAPEEQEKLLRERQGQPQAVDEHDGPLAGRYRRTTLQGLAPPSASK